jgi:hypothetical protein
MKTILHLCADLGSDSRPYQLANGYKVILIGKDIGVENYSYIDNGGGRFTVSLPTLFVPIFQQPRVMANKILNLAWCWLIIA